MALLCCAFGLACVCYWPVLKTDAYGYDEADYMYAARQGILANYWDAGSVSWMTFLRYGVDHLRGERSARELSELIRGNQDVGFYRHYHAPLYFYGLSTARQLLGDHERAVRATSFLWLFATVFAAYAGCILLCPGSCTPRGEVEDAGVPPESAGNSPFASSVTLLPGTEGRMAGLVVGGLLMTSTPNLATAAIVTPHSAYVLTSVATLILLARYLKTGWPHWGYATVAVLAISFLAFEYAPLLLVTVLICVLLYRRRLCAAARGWSTKRILASAATVLLRRSAAVLAGGVAETRIAEELCVLRVPCDLPCRRLRHTTGMGSVAGPCDSSCR